MSHYPKKNNRTFIDREKRKEKKGCLLTGNQTKNQTTEAGLSGLDTAWSTDFSSAQKALVDEHVWA